MEEVITINYAHRPLTISSGGVAKQADGSVLVRYLDTVVLVTIVASREPSTNDFFPLTVNYQEMSYAAGKFPGGFFKREGRPSDREILMSRLIDRPLRPLFPKGFKNEVQIIATVLSADQECDPAILGIIGASCAATISEIPFEGPVGGVRIGRKDGVYIINPSANDLEVSDIDIVVAGTKEAILMVEGTAKFITRSELIEAIRIAHENIFPLIHIQEQLRETIGKPKWSIPDDTDYTTLMHEMEELIQTRFIEASSISPKKQREAAQMAILNEVVSRYATVEPGIIKRAFDDVTKKILRTHLCKTEKRIDGRSPDEIRTITCQVGILPRTHGSALFTRGETQSLAVTTFGTSEDEQKVESLLEGETFKTFMLHYNFPPFSVGEVAMLRGPSRREIGHGNLAEKALQHVIPPKESFPYTIRIVSEILESNGSSSMATVCSGCLSLMDAGVPIREPVAGIAMGLVKEGEQEIILSDILGDEDHLGDMDFKIAGTRTSITAIQMDIKIKGIALETLSRAIEKGQEGINTILDIMNKTIDKPRESLSPYAPRIFTIHINPDKIRDVIGPGGKIIKGIIDQTGVKIDIEDSGIVTIVSQDEQSANKAIEIIRNLTREVELGGIYLGKVKKVIDSGVIVEVLPGTDGYVHISQLGEGFIKKVSDVAKEGDEMLVKVVDIDQNGRIKLSRKAALREQRKQQS